MKLQKMAGAFSGVILLFGASSCSVRGENGQTGPNLGGIIPVNGSGKVVGENRPVRDLNGVELETIGALRIIQDGTESLTVTADDNILPLITSVQSGGRLVLGTKGNIGHVTKLEFVLRVKNLDSVKLSGMGSVAFDALKGDDLSLELSGMGSLEGGPVGLGGKLTAEVSGMGSLKLGKTLAAAVRVDLSGAGGFDIAGLSAGQAFEAVLSGMGSLSIGRLEARNVRLECSGAGGVTVEELQGQTIESRLSGMGNVEILGGAVDTQVANVDSMGSYRAEDLDSKTARVRSSSLGSASVTATRELDAEASSSGSIDFAGNPPVVRAEKSGLGSINRR